MLVGEAHLHNCIIVCMHRVAAMYITQFIILATMALANAIANTCTTMHVCHLEVNLVGDIYIYSDFNILLSV